jgi:hypothetical protein
VTAGHSPAPHRPTHPNNPHTHLPSPLIFFFPSAAGNKPTAPPFQNQTGAATPFPHFQLLLPSLSTFSPNRSSPSFSFTAASTAPARQDQVGRPLTRLLPSLSRPNGLPLRVNEQTRHSGAHRTQIGPPSSSSSSPSTAAPTAPDLSAAHPSTPSPASLPDRARPSSGACTPPRPNTAASPSQRICHLKKEREADPKEEETDLRRETDLLVVFWVFCR